MQINLWITFPPLMSVRSISNVSIREFFFQIPERIYRANNSRETNQIEVSYGIENITAQYAIQSV